MLSLQKKQARNGYLNHLLAQIKPLADASSDRLPAFSAMDIQGKSISSTTYSAAPVAIIYTWASWSYESSTLQQRLLDMQTRANGKLQLLGINLDASRKSCKENLESQGVRWPVVCDEQLFKGPLVLKLGLTSVPDNLLLQRGRVIARGLSTDDLIARIEKMI